MELLLETIKAWNITIQMLSVKDPIQRNHTNVTVVTHADVTDPISADQSFQHVGLKITKLATGGLKISNPKIIQRLLVDHGLTDCNPTTLPYTISADLSARKPNEATADKKAYQTAVGTLRFIADTTHPGLAWILGILGRHLHDPAPRHLTAIKPVLRYLSTCVHDGPTFTRTGPLQLTCYTDSDYAADPDTRRSITGILCLASEQPVLWGSARQCVLTHSYTEAEYISADTGARTLTWLSSLASELRISVVERPPSLRIDDKPAPQYHDGHIIVDTRPDLRMLIDNKGAVDIAHTNGPSKRTKHLDVRHHYIQQQVHSRAIYLSQIPSSEQRADFLTKPVGRKLFKQALSYIGFPE